MKLAVVFPVHNQHLLSEAVLDVAKHNLSGENEVEFFVIDNASDKPFIPNLAPIEKGNFTLHGKRLEKNIGVYPIFWEALRDLDSSFDIVAYFHSDVFIAEAGWDTRVINTFEEHPELGLLGFIGSNEIDGSGGRGLGTSSNFMGQEYTKQAFEAEDGQEATVVHWYGSAAEIHGRRETGYMKAAVVDGCVMIFRRPTLEKIPERKDFPPHHFYDRLLSCEVAEMGYEIGVLGVEFDHISGQTVNQESSYGVMAEEWARTHVLGAENGLPEGIHNWDTVLYLDAERKWLGEYRDVKHFIPRTI